MNNQINRFDGNYAFLSNFYTCKIEMEGKYYLSVEAAFQAAKALDVDRRIPFELASPSVAKRAGKKLPLRPDWEQVKVPIMRSLLIKKFSIPVLKESLLFTRDKELVEGNNWHDAYWGVCNGDCRQRGPHAPTGYNVLGKLLMEVREMYMRETFDWKL